MIFMCIILDIRIPFFLILLKPFFDLWSCQLESSTQHLILSPPLECVENGSYQVEWKSDLPNQSSSHLSALDHKDLSTTTSILLSLDKNIKTWYLHLLQNVFQTSYLFEQVHSNSEYNYKSLKHEWENFIALSFCWFFFFLHWHWIV